MAETETALASHTREARDCAAKAGEIEDAVYYLKAVNPNKKPEIDDRTPADLLALIEAKGREITTALTALRSDAYP